jgi:hypothetical protein
MSADSLQPGANACVHVSTLPYKLLHLLEVAGTDGAEEPVVEL